MAGKWPEMAADARPGSGESGVYVYLGRSEGANNRLKVLSGFKILKQMDSGSALGRAPHPFNTSTSVLPSRAGDGDTLMPAASMAAIFDSASPLPPEMIAPA